MIFYCKIAKKMFKQHQAKAVFRNTYKKATASKKLLQLEN